MSIKKLLVAAFFLSISIASFAAGSGSWNNLNGPNSGSNLQGRVGYQCVEECTHTDYGQPRDVCTTRCS